MEVESRCALSAGSLVWQPRPKAWVLTVACKATYRLFPNEARLVEPRDQEPIHEEDGYWEDDPRRSLRFVSDLVPFKQRCDVLVTGLAYPPPAGPVRSFTVRLRVGGIDKRIEVFGRRRLLPSGAVEEEPAERVALAYENAADGAANPVGRTRDDRDDQGRVRLPQLVRPEDSGVEFGVPVGLGPIAPTWPSRARFAPGQVSGWTSRMWRAAPMPEGVDPRFFNAAPEDQQLDSLLPDEMILLSHLQPIEATLITRLPGVLPVVTLEREGHKKELPMRADTLWIDTERGLCTLAWRGQEQVDAHNPRGRVVVSLDRMEPRSLREIALANRSRRPSAAPKTTPPPEPSDSQPAVFLPPEATSTLAPVASRIPAVPFSTSAPKDMPPPPPEAKPPAAPVPAPSSRNSLPSSSPQETQVLRPDMLPDTAWPFPEPAAAKAPPAPPPPPPPGPPPPERVQRPPAAAPQVRGTIGERVSLGLSPAEGDAQVPPARPTEAKAQSSGADVAAAAPRVGSLDMLKKGPALSVQKVSDEAAGANAPVAAPPAAERTPVAPGRGSLIELLWFDATCLDAVRHEREWRSVLRSLKPRPRDADSGEEHSDPKQQETKDRREVSAILSRGTPEPTRGLLAALGRGADVDGSFTPPLVLLEGTLAFLFDELEHLKATADVVSPHVQGDDHRLKQAVEAAREAVQAPWIQRNPAHAEKLRRDIEEAFGAGKRPVSPKDSRAAIHRALLEGRHYQETSPAGQPWIRTAFRLPGESGHVPAYLPAAPSKELPLLDSFPARIVAEVRPRMEMSEAHDLALRVVALGRVLSV